MNEDYEGGDFIMWETEKIELPQGSIMIFPSNFMYPHKVTPVTSGTRYSYVSWTY
jgi:predicted 2-oxoglutarate/Fe(II)-dependent dioxygenase YbiX